MIVILNGPLGVGKTETAWQLMKRFERAAVLDCDYVGGNVSSFDIASDRSFETTLSSIEALAMHQRNKFGLEHFIVSGVFEIPDQLSRACARFSAISTPVVCFALLTNPAQLRKRVLERGNDVGRELRRAFELLSIFESSDGLGVKIDTTTFTISDTIEFLMSHIQSLHTH